MTASKSEWIYLIQRDDIYYPLAKESTEKEFGFVASALSFELGPPVLLANVGWLRNMQQVKVIPCTIRAPLRSAQLRKGQVGRIIKERESFDLYVEGGGDTLVNIEPNWMNAFDSPSNAVYFSMARDKFSQPMEIRGFSQFEHFPLL